MTPSVEDRIGKVCQTTGLDTLVPIFFVLGTPWGVLLAGSLALISGGRLIFGLITKAAYKQGYGIGELRKGRPGIKPLAWRKGDPIQL